ncbi:cell surface protein, partial [Streptomyces sp. NPDC048279]
EQEKRQEELQKQQDQKQAEQEKRQEELQKQQDQKQAEQEKRQEELQKQQDEKQAEQEKRQEELQKQQDQKQIQTQADYQQKQAEQEAKQAELQKQQDQKQAELEKQWQSQYGQQLSDLPPGADYNDSRTVLNPDGSLTTHYPDGGSTTVAPDQHSVVTVGNDGSIDIKDLSPGHSVHNPDGSWTTLNSDGTVTTDYPDGHSTVVDPGRGLVETTYPDGRTETTPLSPGSPLPAYSDGGTDFRSPYEEELYDDSSYDPSDLLGAAQTGDSGGLQQTGNSMGPFLPPGTTVSGQVSGGSQGERIRTVLNGGQQTVTNRRGGGRNGTQGYDEVGTAQPTASATSSGMPFMPPMGGAGQGQKETESSERARMAWTPEEEDVWGTDEGGAPAVIGR